MKERKSDILWKMVMDEVFEDLLRFVFPDADQVYNLERGFEFLDKELAEMYPEPEKESDTRFADKLVKVFHRDGEEEWVLLHIEIQGDTSRRVEFAERMFRYFYRILDRYRRPVSAVAIFTGQYGKNMPTRFEYAYRRTRLVYEYHSLSILDFTDKELEESDNPFALVVEAARTSLLEEKIPEEELLQRKILVGKRLLTRGFAPQKIRAIFTFLENYVLFEDPEMNRTFREQIEPYDKNKVMSVDEVVKLVAQEEEREKRSRLFVDNLLSNTEFSVEKIASLADVPVEFVNKVKAGLKAK
ncbi:MAG TPA: hypothetical protein VNS58_20385 [Puia sp.]|nr:hypothetical protein [Puia sp.]